MSFQHFPSLGEETNIITFSAEDISFQLENETYTREWLKKMIEREEKQLHSLNFIFCPDDYLLQLTIEYLDHDTLTDIITFPYADPPVIEGDVFISIDRIKENAKKYDVTFSHELFRVMAHGVLHLCGYGDKSREEAKLMRQKENEALQILESEK